MKLRSLRAMTLVALLLLGSRATGQVVVNEIFYHAPDDLDDLEYVELFNTSSEPVDVSGWELAKGVEFEFPAGTSIAAGGYVVIAKDVALLKEFYRVDAVGEYKNSLSNSGDEVQLKDRAGKVVESVAYRDSGLWPASADGGSASLERICPTAPAGTPANWAPSVLSKDYDKLPSGTPGKANSVFAKLPPPTIEAVTWEPLHPKPDAQLTISVQAGDLKNIVLYYRAVAPGEIGDEETLELVADGKGRYTGQIPTGAENNRLLRFRIVATDQGGGVASVPAKNDFRPAFTVYVSDTVEAGKIPVLQFFHAEKAAFDDGEKYRQEQARLVPFPPGQFGFGPPGRRGDDRAPPGRRPDDRPLGERRPDGPRPDGAAPGDRGPGGPPGPPGFFGFFGPPRTPLVPQGPSAVIYTDPKTGKSEVLDFVNIVRRKSGWKVRFHKDRPLLEMTTLNVLYEPNEETILNEALAYELYRLAGNVSYLSGYMRLVIDGQPVGYHLYFEQPNGSFFRRNKIDDSGDLYKLIWMGNAPISKRLAKEKQPQRRDIAGRYEKRTHRHGDYQQLIALIEQLEGAKTDEEMWSIIEKNFEVDQVINYFAVNSLLAHWDGFFNNFFFYYDRQGSGKWTLYPWDQDSTWSQRGGPPEELYQMPIYFGAQGARPEGLVKTPLGERRPASLFPFGFGGPGNRLFWWRDGGDISRPLLANPEFYGRFKKRLAELTDKVFTKEAYQPKIDELVASLEPEVRLRASIRKSDEEEAVKRLQGTADSLLKHLVQRRAFVQKELQRDEK